MIKIDIELFRLNVDMEYNAKSNKVYLSDSSKRNGGSQ